MTLQQLRYAVVVAQKGSMNEAAKELYISQPSLSEAIRELEKEIGLLIFQRSNRGITVTSEGSDFLGYARQVLDQYRMLEEQYLSTKTYKKHFHVSTQHYTFAVHAFAQLMKQTNMEKYDFAIYETRTAEIIEDVRNFRSDIGVLYIDDVNEKMLKKLFKEKELVFEPLFDCHIYAFLSSRHPLAKEEKITFGQLEAYTCMTFDQGENNAFYLSEEVFQTNEYKKTLKVNDRATMLNMMVAINGYTLCSGVISEELNGDGYTVVPLDTEQMMTIGYLIRKDAGHNELRELYIQELQKCKKNVL